MTNPLRIKKDDLFKFFDSHGEGLFTYREMLRNGMLLFLSQETGRSKRISTTDFEDLLMCNKVVRLSGRDPVRAALQTETALLASLNLEDTNLSPQQKMRSEAAAVKLKNAETLAFYLAKWERRPDVRSSQKPVSKMVREYMDEARERGLTWLPSYSALYRARESLAGGNVEVRKLIATYGVHDENKRYQPFILQLKKEMILLFWSGSRPDEADVIAEFFVAFAEERVRRERAGLDCPNAVSYSTLQRWIKRAKNFDNFKARYGARAANRHFRGRGKAISADAPLEYVIFDHTQIDAWAKYVDEDGQEHWERPWLVIGVDVWSSAIVGGVITFEPPSLLSIMACLQQAVRKKTFLIERYGECKGATDVYGKVGTAILDNGWEGVGKSFKTCLHNAGVDVEWAPVRTPEYKTFCERAFGTFNTSLWHKLEAGIPFKPGRQDVSKPDPRNMPKFTIEELTDRFWDLIVTRLHLETCDRIHMAPARKWALGLKAHGREFMDNISDLDRLFGGVSSATLTADGVFHEGFRFHHKDDVTTTLDALMRHAPERFQRSADNSTGKVRVQLTKNMADCSYIDIWDYERKTFVRLYNTDERFSAGLDWKLAKNIKKWAQAENVKFHSAEEKYAARVAYNKSLRVEAKAAPFKIARKAVRQLHSEHRLIPGVTVVSTVADPSVSGMNGVDIPQVFVGGKRSGNHIPSKGHKRGGAKVAARKVAPAKSAALAPEQRPLEPPSSPRRCMRDESYEVGHEYRSVPTVQNPATLMAAFEAEMIQKGAQR